MGIVGFVSDLHLIPSNRVWMDQSSIRKFRCIHIVSNQSTLETRDFATRARLFLKSGGLIFSLDFLG